MKTALFYTAVIMGLLASANTLRIQSQEHSSPPIHVYISSPPTTQEIPSLPVINRPLRKTVSVETNIETPAPKKHVDIRPRSATPPDDPVPVKSTETVPDLNVVIYQPEIPQPQQVVTIYDERTERLLREHRQRLRERETRPQSLPGSF